MRSILLILLLASWSCSPTAEPVFDAPYVQTGMITSINADGVQFNGLITLNGKEASEVGFVWDNSIERYSKKYNSPVVGQSYKKSIPGFSKGPFSITISNAELASKTPVMIRAYGKSGSSIVYGDTIFFKPLHPIEYWSEVAYTSPAPSPVGRLDPTSFVINGEAYYGTGLNGSDRADFYKFSPATKVWTKLADFPGGGRSRAAGFSIGNIGYVGLGPNARHLWAYDPSTNIWTQKANAPTEADKGFYTWFAIGNKAYCGLGASAKYFYEYDPQTDLWTRLADFPGNARTGLVMFSGNGKAYLGLGVAGESYLRDFWEYDPGSNKWTAKASFPGLVRSGSTSMSRGDRGMFLGGSYYSNVDFSTTYYMDSWEYDMTNNTWNRRQDLPRIKTNASSAFTVGNISYIMGGSDYTTFFTTYLTYTW